MTGRARKQPSGLAGGAAWLCAFLLVPVLACLAFSLIGRQAATSVALHEQVALDGSVLDGQEAWLREKIARLAKQYDFPAEKAAASLTRESLEDMNRQVIRWWTGMLRTGREQDIPLWDAEPLKEALRADEAFSAGLTATRLKGRVNQVASEVTMAVKKAVFPLRDSVLTGGIAKLCKSVDLAGLARVAQQAPLILALCAAVLGGLILLLLGANPKQSLRFFGSAAGGAAILMLACVICLILLGPGAMIEEASPRLMVQYARLRTLLALETAAAILGLTAGMVVCLFRRRKHEA